MEFPWCQIVGYIERISSMPDCNLILWILIAKFFGKEQLSYYSNKNCPIIKQYSVMRAHGMISKIKFYVFQ